MVPETEETALRETVPVPQLRPLETVGVAGEVRTEATTVVRELVQAPLSNST